MTSIDLLKYYGFRTFQQIHVKNALQFYICCFNSKKSSRNSRNSKGCGMWDIYTNEEWRRFLNHVSEDDVEYCKQLYRKNEIIAN